MIACIEDFTSTSLCTQLKAMVMKEKRGVLMIVVDSTTLLPCWFALDLHSSVMITTHLRRLWMPWNASKWTWANQRSRQTNTSQNLRSTHIWHAVITSGSKVSLQADEWRKNSRAVCKLWKIWSLTLACHFRKASDHVSAATQTRFIWLFN